LLVFSFFFLIKREHSTIGISSPKSNAPSPHLSSVAKYQVADIEIFTFLIFAKKKKKEGKRREKEKSKGF